MSSRTDQLDEDRVFITTEELDEALATFRRLSNAGAKPARLLTQAEAMERLGVSRTTLNTLFGKGELTRLKLGRSVKVAEADVERFIARLGEQ